MPTTFNVINLGVQADIDTTEGNTTAENAAALVGLTFGGTGNSLAGNIQSFSPGSTTFNSDGNTYYDMNDATPETFRINGGANQGFDGTSVYNATITYFDGTTATITAVVFQDTAGNTYLAPEFSANADQTALEAGPIFSLTLDSLSGNVFSGMTGSRETNNLVPCFVAGTQIQTLNGPRSVETLTVGTPIVTQDNGIEPIRWIGAVTRAVGDDLRPIRIRKGALGCGLPVRDLLVSPQHRMLVRSHIAERITGAKEILVPAKKLLGIPGIEPAHEITEVTYVHLMFDTHQVIFAEGAPTESLLPGAQALTAIGAKAEAELRALFPELESLAARPARVIPKGQFMRQLVARHTKNERALLAA